MLTTIFMAIIILVSLWLLMNIPMKFTRVLSRIVVRVAIAVLLLFFTNVFGGYIGLHIPMNFFTVTVSTVLGVFGIIALAALQLFVL
ncbi:MAG TPA: pro-sigmaK processing inhibitor BofA family protein [Bacillota bacterium]|nr:pro-sigmaK processing inhibitor BofA family protein [Bacillota bacterium]